MRFTPLTEAEAAASGFTHRLDMSYTDIPPGLAAAAAYVWNVPPMPGVKASDIVKSVEMHVTTKFQNTADAAFNSDTVSLGDATLATRFLSAVEVNFNGTAVVDTIPGAAPNYVYTAAAQIQLTMNSMAAKTLSSLNKGALYILFNILRAAGVYEKTPPFGQGYA